MTFLPQVQHALAALPLFSSGGQLLAVSDGGLELRCELAALDTLACSFERIALRADRLAGNTPAQLKQVAEKLSQRLTYLLEPISPIEFDAQGCTVQMRSNPPRKDEDGTSYYELLVSHSGELSLCRYMRPPGGMRSIIPAHVTREVLLRIVDDFVAVTS